MVALIWALLFAQASGGKLTAADAAVLVLAVWIIYVTDRLLDTRTTKNPVLLQQRHHFCERHPWTLCVLLGVAGAVILWLTANRLPAAEVDAGVKLGAILFLYMATIHAGPAWIARVLPKELAVGFLFAAGSVLPSWSQSSAFRWPVVLPWALLALLCSLNCLSIECWENRRSDSPNPPHAFVRWAGPRIDDLAAILAAAALLACSVQKHSPDYVMDSLAIAAGAVLLLILNRSRSTLSPEALRVLADAALVVPPLIALTVRVAS